MSRLPHSQVNFRWPYYRPRKAYLDVEAPVVRSIDSWLVVRPPDPTSSRVLQPSSILRYLQVLVSGTGQVDSEAMVRLETLRTLNNMVQNLNIPA
jgi:hypothetical protein